MKKTVILGLLFLLIFSNIFADDNSNEFENVFFTWQFPGYFNRNNENPNGFINLNRNLIPEFYHSLSFNPERPIPQLPEFNMTPIGPVTASLAGFIFFVEMERFIKEYQEYMMYYPPEFNNNLYNSYQYPRREESLSERLEREHQQRLPTPPGGAARRGE
ncbi:MAG: hypothetical protein LBI28_01350 [Treponema sp.]|jgi:hypothetical protein|nr:hypothetical protein [Treponema sp.]